MMRLLSQPVHDEKMDVRSVWRRPTSAESWWWLRRTRRGWRWRRARMRDTWWGWWPGVACKRVERFSRLWALEAPFVTSYSLLSASRSISLSTHSPPPSASTLSCMYIYQTFWFSRESVVSQNDTQENRPREKIIKKSIPGNTPFASHKRRKGYLINEIQFKSFILFLI